MLEAVKRALRLTKNTYDAELSALIAAAKADLKISDIDNDVIDGSTVDPLVQMAVITYCRMNFGSPADYDKLKASYENQKAQMITATGYGFEVIE